MKRLAAGAAWLLLLLVLGALAGLAFGAALIHRPPPPAVALRLLGGGATAGADLFLFGVCFALLPGARRPRGAAQKLGLAQGVWAVLGYAAIMLAASLLVNLMLSAAQAVLIVHHAPHLIDFLGTGYLLANFLTVEAAVALFTVHYLRRFSPAQREDGGATGIAWRAAPGRAYAMAALFALAIIAQVIVMYHLVPPDTTKLQNLPMAKLFSVSGPALLPPILIATFLAPVLEEIIFRGIAFAGLAAQLGTVWATIVSVALFVAVHAPQKIYYLPGFVDVGLVALAAILLRLKYRSIRPGILLHILYNGGSMLAVGLFQ
jgi:membrane protease YdiL (CAAX protease family)